MFGIPIVVEVRAAPGSEVLGLDPGAPIVAGTVEVARAEPPRDIRSAITSEEGLAEIEVAGAGAYLVSLTHNVAGGAFVGDARIEVSGAGERFELGATPIQT